MGLTDDKMNVISQPSTPEKHIAMSTKTAEIIGECMRMAVLEGTAKAGASDKITSAAKTGTADSRLSFTTARGVLSTSLRK